MRTETADLKCPFNYAMRTMCLYRNNPQELSEDVAHLTKHSIISNLSIKQQCGNCFKILKQN